MDCIALFSTIFDKWRESSFWQGSSDSILCSIALLHQGALTTGDQLWRNPEGAMMTASDTGSCGRQVLIIYNCKHFCVYAFHLLSLGLWHSASLTVWISNSPSKHSGRTCHDRHCKRYCEPKRKTQISQALETHNISEKVLNKDTKCHMSDRNDIGHKILRKILWSRNMTQHIF